MVGSGWLWLVALFCAALWWAVNREAGATKTAIFRGREATVALGTGGKEEGTGEIIKRLFNFLLWTIAVLAFLYAPVPLTSWSLAAGLADVFTLIYGVFDTTIPIGVPAELALYVLVIAMLIDLKGKRVDVVARISICLAPSVAALATGPFGPKVAGVLASITGASVDLVQHLAQ